MHGYAVALPNALALAVLPVAVAVERNNTMDGMLTLTLVLAAGAFWRAAETGRRRDLWLGALWVGLGFNIKMLQAYLPLPAFLALYLLAAPVRWRRKAADLAVAGLIVLAVSAVWVVAVDLTPADQRPYIGGTQENLATELTIGHNGLQRLFGRSSSVSSLLSTGNTAGGGGQTPTQSDSAGGSGRSGTAGRPGDAQTSATGASRGNAGGGGSGGSEVGQPGLARFWAAPLSAELSWLLPAGLFGLAALVARKKWRWPLDRDGQAAMLWGGWLLTCLAFFSTAEYFHAYYLAIMGPPLAALLGAGAGRLMERHREGARWAGAALCLGAAVTVAYQWINARQFQAYGFWLPLGAALCLVGAALWWAPAWVPAGKAGERRWRAAGAVALLLAVTAVPLAWAWYTNQRAATTPPSLGAYQGPGSASRGADSGGRDVDRDLLAYLEANTQDTRYLLAVSSAKVGDAYVLETGRPVLFMGGYAGDTPVATAEDLAALAAGGELKYILLSDGGGGEGTQSAIRDWVEANCTVVDDWNGANGAGTRGSSAGTLYDASALATAATD